MKKTRTNWPKIVLQIGVLSALVIGMCGIIKFEAQPDPEKYCPVGGLQALVTYFANHSLPCSMSSVQIMMGLAMAIAVILFSKLFCGYICPVGTVEDLLAKLRTATGLGIDIRPWSIGDRILRSIKYILLFVVFYSTATASELLCKNFDPYYAVATGFKGEIALPLSITALVLVIAGGFFIKRFWCRYICPMGAASNSFKFWLPMLILTGVWAAVKAIWPATPWWTMLAAWCLCAYLLEILASKPRLQVLHVVSDLEKCGRTCHSCRKACPYSIDVPAHNGIVTSVDCTLCGECIAACPTSALHIGVCAESKKCKFLNWLPGILAVVFVALGIVVGSRFELPTIDESWGIEDGMKLSTLRVEGIKSVKCFGSSMAFKARMENVRGVHGVKTYVGSHTVVIKYDPAVTSEEKLQAEIFVPSHFRIWSPDPKKLSELKVVTIRTEHMYDKLDLNYLGLQFRTTGKSIFGVESEYNCPLIVRVYMAPDEEADEEWFREVVERKMLSMPVHGGGTKDTPVDFEFVRMEPGEGRIAIKDYLEKMFDPFTAEFNGRYADGDSTVVRKRVEQYAGKPQFIYEVTDQNYEKPIIKRGLPFLSNHLSKEEGVIGLYLKLNKDLVPSIQIRYAAPMTAERIWELMTMDKWTITYSGDDVREENARMKFDKPGTSFKYEE